MAEVKLVMTWNIQSGKEREYIEFAVGELDPGLTHLGAQVTDAWFTQAGAGPHMVVGVLVESAEAARALMVSAEFERLREQLFTYVEDFRWRITSPNGSLFHL